MKENCYWDMGVNNTSIKLLVPCFFHYVKCPENEGKNEWKQISSSMEMSMHCNLQIFINFYFICLLHTIY